MKNIAELQRKTTEIGEELADLLHAASLNLHALALHPALSPPPSLIRSQSTLVRLQQLL